MSLVHRGKLDIKLGEYAVGAAGSLVDPLLVNAAQDYRRHAAARMIPLEPDDILKRFPRQDCRVSLKVDGEFDILVYSEGEAILVNPGGTVRMGLPVLKEAVELLKKSGTKKAILAGELYVAKGSGKRTRVHDVSRVARQPASQAELEQLAFAAFDIIEWDGKPFRDTHENTWKKLTDVLKPGTKCQVVESKIVSDASGVEAEFRKWVDDGAEGVVVRSDAVGTFKIKPRHTIDAVVIGFTEGTEDRVGMIHDLLIALMRPDGCLHIIGHVGGGFSNEDRRGFLSDLKDMIVDSDYTEVNDQVAYHMVRPDWIIEISVLDLISHSTRGVPVKKMALQWAASEKKYRIVRRLPSVGLISPQFVRRREDKSLNAQDIRLSQVTDIVEVPLADRDARQLSMAPSQVLRREVYTKVLKGATMVRKLVMWQTNKSQENEEFPAFVVHYTDFSPNRKTPLEREIRISSSRHQIDDLWKELADEAFTKGWERVPEVAVVPGTFSAKLAAEAAAPEPTLEPATTSTEEPAPKKRGKKPADNASVPADAVTTDEKPAAKKRAPKKK